MKNIRIGIVGGGYMGKAHAVAYNAVGSVFNTKLRPILEMVCASTDKTANLYREAYGFSRCTSKWQELVEDKNVEAIVIASPQIYHREIVELACNLGKHVFNKTFKDHEKARKKYLKDLRINGFK